MDGLRLALSVGVLGTALGCGSTPVDPAPAAKAAAPRPVPSAVQAEMRKVPVAMYMTEWCPYCLKARDWLKTGGYNFIEHDVERNDRAAAVLLALNPRGSVPMFDVDGFIVVGFEPAELHAAIRARAATKPAGAGWGQAAPQ